MYRVGFTADLNDEDQTGYLWTFLWMSPVTRPRLPRVPSSLPVTKTRPPYARSLIFVPAGDGTIVHLRLLPGLVDDYRALVDRALAS
jgi:hypothetical protein